MSTFKLRSPFKPTGDQPQAITKLLEGVKQGYREQTLLGVTGSGKTFTMANVIAAIGRPTLVISHNKTLAAQLASEFREFFPENAVHYFVSYYDYYQPEAYVPQSDTYIEKETSINEEIDRLRNAATQSLVTRKDVIIVASVSCIYGLGDPEDYKSIRLTLMVGQQVKRQQILRHLATLQYNRNAYDLDRGMFRVKGDTIEVFPSYEEKVYRVELEHDTIARITAIHPLTHQPIEEHVAGGTWQVVSKTTRHTLRAIRQLDVFPAKHFVTPESKLKLAIANIKAELAERLAYFKSHEKPLEAERLEQRTNFDLEMIEQVGFSSGIENYSRHLAFRKAGEPPFTLIDYFPKDFLLFIDESHMTLPQIRGMYEGDRSRKQVLVDYGFRLPSALDNRPLKWEEFEKKINQVIYVSATPRPEEINRSKQVAEQLIRPTGLLDPTVEVRPTAGQIENLLAEINERVKRGERVLVTTLTKRMAEDLAEHLAERKVKVHYLHAEIQTFERLEILRDLRQGKVDVVVGINLLREGLDLPEVSLVAILDADKEGFLRSETSLIQVMGRAARHSRGHVIMYADTMTGSMKRAIEETQRRRGAQEAYNKNHGIVPKTITKPVREDTWIPRKEEKVEEFPALSKIPKDELPHLIKDLEQAMDLAARNLEFERAAVLRDQITDLKKVIRGKVKRGGVTIPA